MGIRQNYRNLTNDEQTRFVQALFSLKDRGVIDRFARVHRTHTAAGIYHSSHFLPWHREFILRFEQELRAIDGSLSIPYWDSTADSSPSDPLWHKDFLGQFDQRWRLDRALGSAALPTRPMVEANQRRDDYSSFRIELESNIHHPPHNWVSGVMATSASPGDPAFFLHHAWIDLLWARWQRSHPDAPFVSSGPGRGVDDPLLEWPGRTPAVVLDHHSLGYRYDVEGSGPELDDPVVAAARTAPTVPVAGGEPQRAVRRRDDGAQTAVLADKQRHRTAQ